MKNLKTLLREAREEFEKWRQNWFIDFSAADENFDVFLLKFDDFPLKFIKLRAAGAKKMKISKPYFQLSMKFEKSQNQVFKILKTLKTPRARFGIR